MLRRTKKPDALQGTLDLLVLTILSRGPEHGYGIAARIETITDDLLRVEEGSLYPALHRMEQAGWIAAEWQITDNNRRARYYALTAAGRAHLRAQTDTWLRYSRVVTALMTSRTRNA